MSELVVGSGVALGLGGAAYWWHRYRLRRLSLERLGEGQEALETEAVEEEEVAVAPAPVLRRHRVAPWGFALVFLIAMLVFAPVAWQVCVTLSFVVGVLATLVEEFLYYKRVHLIERQLADAIDLITGSLTAGSGLIDALEGALREARYPISLQFEDILGRIRLGDDPKRVMADLADRVPLETFRLFSFALAVHWEVGGSLAPTLSTVGRTVRDRIELARRVRSQATQAQFSVVGILFISYGVALLMYLAEPYRFTSFITSTAGVWVASIAIFIQAIGLIWMNKLARIEY